MKKLFLTLMLCGLGLAALSVPAWADKDGLPTLSVKKMGQLFVGGAQEPFPGGRGGWPNDQATQWFDHSIVFYVIPQKQKFNVPVVLIPGFGLNCNMYLSTPDDREGWVPIFARLGHPTYCLNVTPAAQSRIRTEQINACIEAGQDADPDVQAICDEAQSLSLSAKEEPLNIWGICAEREAPFDENDPASVCPPVPDGQFPVGNLDEFAKSLEVGQDGGGRFGAATTQAALKALLDKIGPSILVAHSAAGSASFGTVADNPELVAGFVAYEAVGCDADDAGQFIAGNIPFLSPYGNADERVEGGGHPGRRAACAALAQAITDGGGSGTAYDLAIDFGLPGHSHMYAQDLGNEKIAKIISKWIKDNVE